MNIHEINTEQIQTMRKNFKLLREKKIGLSKIYQK